MVDLSKFTFNKKNIEWSCSLSLQPSILPKFNYVGSKKNLRWSQSFFNDKKIINF